MTPTDHTHTPLLEAPPSLEARLITLARTRAARGASPQEVALLEEFETAYLSQADALARAQEREAGLRGALAAALGAYDHSRMWDSARGRDDAPEASWATHARTALAAAPEGEG